MIVALLAVVITAAAFVIVARNVKGTSGERKTDYRYRGGNNLKQFVFVIHRILLFSVKTKE